MAGNRSRRINGEMQKCFADILRTEMKDPRISIMTSVVRAEVTNDLSYANIFVSIYDTDKMKKSTIIALNHAHGFLRSEIAKRLKLRKIPELRIFEDDSMEQSAKIAKIIDDIGVKDKDE
jgi:ribosome-binding factor A